MIIILGVNYYGGNLGPYSKVSNKKESILDLNWVELGRALFNCV